jgi:hypothetical protein
VDDVSTIGLKDIFEAGTAIEVKFDEGLARQFLAYLVDGMSEKNAIAQVDGLTSYRVKQWRVSLERFEQMYQFALRERSYAQLDEILEIAEDATDDAVMGATGPTINGKAIRRAELQINVRKWMMGKMLPKVFGDKSQMELTGADGKDLAPATINIGLIPTGSFISEDAARQQNDALRDDDDAPPASSEG